MKKAPNPIQEMVLFHLTERHYQLVGLLSIILAVQYVLEPECYLTYKQLKVTRCQKNILIQSYN